MTTLNLALAALCLILIIALIVPPILAHTESKIRPEDLAAGCLYLALAGLIGLALALTLGT